jgi:hypothetical protein
MGCLDDRTCRLGKGGRLLLTATRSTEGMLGCACALEGWGGSIPCVNTGAHGMVAPMTAAAIGEDIFTPLLSG